MFPDLLPALRIDLRMFFGDLKMMPAEVQWRTEGLVQALMHGGVMLRGVSIDPDGETWVIFRNEKDRHDVHATLQAVLAEMKHNREEADASGDLGWLTD